MRLFAFTGREHQPALYAGLTAIAAGIALVALGYAHWSWLVLSALVLELYLIVGSIGFHRLFCHKAFRTNRFVEFILLWIGTLGCYGSEPYFKVAHMRHHTHADTEDDPQQLRTFGDVFRASYVGDRATFKELRMVYRVNRHRPERHFMHRYYWLIVALHAAIFFAIDWRIGLYGWAIPAGGIVFVGRLFNYLAHGGMTEPRNMRWWGFFFWSGEHLHGEHHDRPASWDLRQSVWDVDLGAFIIWLVMKNRPSFWSFVTLEHKATAR